MSNRYVWGRYNLTYTAAYSAMETVPQNHYQNKPYYGVPDYTAVGTSYYTSIATAFTMEGTLFKLSNPVITAPSDEYNVPITTLNDYFYFITRASAPSASTTYKNIYRVRIGYSGSRSVYADVFTGNYYGNRIPCLQFYISGLSGTLSSCSFEEMSATGTKGTANGTVSNSGASTYPPRDYVSKSARIWPYSAPGMRGSGRVSTSMYPLLGAALTI